MAQSRSSVYRTWGRAARIARRVRVRTKTHWRSAGGGVAMVGFYVCSNSELERSFYSNLFIFTYYGTEKVCQ